MVSFNPIHLSDCSLNNYLKDLTSLDPKSLQVAIEAIANSSKELEDSQVSLLSKGDDKVFKASLLLKRYEPLLERKDKQVIAAYASLENLSFIQRKQIRLKFKFFKQGFLRNLKTFIID